jgi:hypothetical protein
LYGRRPLELARTYFPAIMHKIWVLMQMTLGVWTPETLKVMEIESLTEKFGGDTYVKPHLEVIEHIGGWHTLFWQFFPLALVFSKLGEAVNEPPLFVYDGADGVRHMHISDVQERLFPYALNVLRFASTLMLLGFRQEVSQIARPLVSS